MSDLLLDCKTSLALQFVEDMTSIIHDCRGDDATHSRQDLAQVRRRLALGPASYESGEACSMTDIACAVGKAEDSGHAHHTLLQGIVGRFTEWTEGMIDPQTPKTTHRSDVALFQASIKLLDSRLKGLHVRPPSSSYDYEGDELLSAAMKGYYALSNKAARKSHALTTTRASLAALDLQKAQILSDFDRARRVWRTQLLSRAMVIEARDAAINSQAHEILTLRADVARLTQGLHQAHHTLATLCSPLLTQALGLVGAWCGLKNA